MEKKISERNAEGALNQLMNQCTWIIAGSFFFSAIVQFFLASYIVTAEPSEDKALFNEQIGDMTWITYLVILIPSFIITGFALWKLFKGLKQITDVNAIEELLAPQLKEAKK